MLAPPKIFKLGHYLTPPYVERASGTWSASLSRWGELA